MTSPELQEPDSVVQPKPLTIEYVACGPATKPQNGNPQTPNPNAITPIVQGP